MAARNRDSHWRVVTFCVLLQLILLIPLKCHSEIYNLTQHQSLFQGQTLVSPSQIFELGFFTPINSSSKYVGIWYKNISPQTVVWVANRERPLRSTDSQASLTIRRLANLEILDENIETVWSTDVEAPSNSSVAILSDTVNLLLNDGKSGHIIWQSFDHLGNTFLPGSVIGFDIKTNKSSELTSWKSENDPSPGDFVAGLSREKPAQAFIWINGSKPHWRSGPWANSKFLGIPFMNTLYGSPFDIQENVDKGTTYLNYNKYDNWTVENMLLSPQGNLVAIQKDNQGGLYSNWFWPEGECDMYGFCGPFGVCTYSESPPKCKCLKGFVPESSHESNDGNWTKGCMRRVELFCNKSNNTTSTKDEFWKIDKVKLPDFHELVTLDIQDSDHCQLSCLGDCSCAAYAYVETIGCLVWSESLIDIRTFSDRGEDLFVRLAHQELDGDERIKIIVVSLVAIFICVTIGVVACGFRKAKRSGSFKQMMETFGLVFRRESSSDDLQFSTVHNSIEIPVFHLSTIIVATNNFCSENKLGQGGFGSVYKGKLLNGNEIAVKRLSSNSGQGTEEFKNEMKLISKLQHRNLVRLLGYCAEKEERLLIYELMPNKSLDTFIFDPIRCAKLDWAMWLNIIHGVAKGLLYLHRDSCLRVIHRDLKASNILLDNNMNPKISDFGLARMFQGTIDLANTQRVVGTLGYMAPEYAMGGIFSEKSDVFSFGVLILEIVSRKKNTNFHICEQHTSLIVYAWELWSKSRGLELVDETLGESYCSSEAMRCIHIALLCVQDHAADRPNIPDVVFMLSNETNLPEPKQPLFTLQIPVRSEPKHDYRFSVNGVTMSVVEGR